LTSQAREFCDIIARHLFYPENGLFQRAPDHSLEIATPNGIDDRLEEYYSAGLFLGMVLSKKYNIDVFFSHATLKQLLGSIDVEFKDLSLDPELYNGYLWIL
jgi:hypothetical protein